jgi:DNA-directed RNA polymerase specialized sigma subunit
MSNSPDKEAELWRQYWQACEKTDLELKRIARDELVIFYSAFKESLVQKIAQRMIRSLGLSADNLDDLVNDALLYVNNKTGTIESGLLFAIENYNSGLGFSFQKFAIRHILYAMLHGLTAHDGSKQNRFLQAEVYRDLLNDFQNADSVIDFESNYDFEQRLPGDSSTDAPKPGKKKKPKA